MENPKYNSEYILQNGFSEILDKANMKSQQGGGGFGLNFRKRRGNERDVTDDVSFENPAQNRTEPDSPMSVVDCPGCRITPFKN